MSSLTTARFERITLLRVVNHYVTLTIYAVGGSSPVLRRDKLAETAGAAENFGKRMASLQQTEQQRGEESIARAYSVADSNRFG